MHWSFMGVLKDSQWTFCCDIPYLAPTLAPDLPWCAIADALTPRRRARDIMTNNNPGHMPPCPRTPSASFARCPSASTSVCTLRPRSDAHASRLMHRLRARHHNASLQQLRARCDRAMRRGLRAAAPLSRARCRSPGVRRPAFGVRPPIRRCAPRRRCRRRRRPLAMWDGHARRGVVSEPTLRLARGWVAGTPRPRRSLAAAAAAATAAHDCVLGRWRHAHCSPSEVAAHERPQCRIRAAALMARAPAANAHTLAIACSSRAL
jgi:hypothetical protein